MKKKLKDWVKKNQQDRFAFVDKWARYVLTHSDKEWSAQQNKIINIGYNMDKKTYLQLKEDSAKYSK